MRAPHGQFWIYFAAAIFFNLGFSIFYFLFNLYLVGTGLNESSLGVIGSAMAVGSLCGTIPAGMMAERKGLRCTLTCGIGLACAVCATAVGGSDQRFLALWVLQTCSAKAGNV